MGAAHSTVLEEVEREFHRLARNKGYLTLQELVLMRSAYGVELTHIGVLYRLDENADGRFTLQELRAFASAAYSAVSVGFRRGTTSSGGGGSGPAAAGRRPPSLAGGRTGGATSSLLLPPLPPLSSSSSGGVGGPSRHLGWSGPDAMPGLHRDASSDLVPAQCALHLWRRARSRQGRRAFLRWAARLLSEGGRAVIPAAGNVATVREEALMGVHELFDLRRAHGLAFGAWVALLRAAAAEAAATRRGRAAAAATGPGGGCCDDEDDDYDDPEDDAALLAEAAKEAAANRRGRIKEEEEEEEDDHHHAAATSARPPVPVAVLRLFAASVLDGALSVVEGWFDPADLEPGGRVARATSSVLMCGEGGALAAEAPSAAAVAAAKAQLARRSSSGTVGSGAGAASAQVPLIPALW